MEKKMLTVNNIHGTGLFVFGVEEVELTRDVHAKLSYCSSRFSVIPH